MSFNAFIGHTKNSTENHLQNGKTVNAHFSNRKNEQNKKKKHGPGPVKKTIIKHNNRRPFHRPTHVRARYVFRSNIAI